MGVASLASHLADDLTDGRLDSIDSSRMQAGLDAAIGKYASDSAKASLTDAAANTNLVTDAATARDQARTALTAGTSLQQARQIFADLRTSILSIANDAGTGSSTSRTRSCRATSSMAWMPCWSSTTSR
jgi:hypothetical protein